MRRLVIAFVALALVSTWSSRPPHAGPLELSPGAFVRQDSSDLAVQQVYGLLARGEFGAAKLALARVLAQQPSHIDALELSGVVLLREGNHSAAEASLRRALAAGSRNPGTLAKLGVVRLLQKRSDEARSLLIEALRADPDEPVALAYLAWIDETQGDDVAAIGRYERLLSGDRRFLVRDSQVLAALGRLYNRAGRFADTRALLSPAVVREGGGVDAELLQPLLDAVAATGDLAAARDLLTSGRGGRDADAFRFAAGRLARLSGQSGEAEELLRPLTERPGRVAFQALYEVAHLRRDQGDLAAAGAELERAIERAPLEHLPTLLRELAAARISVGDAAGAERTLAAWAAKRPDLPIVRYLIAETQSLSGHTAAALETLAPLVATYPDWAGAHYLAGLLQAKKGDPQAARRSLGRAVELSPTMVLAWRALASAAHDAEGDEAMAAVLRRAIAANPNDPTLNYDLGIAAHTLGDIDEALSAFRKTVAAAPGYSPGVRQLALTIADLGSDPAEALTLAERATRLAPEDPLNADALGWALLTSGQAARARGVLESAAKAAATDGLVAYHFGLAMQATGRAAEGRSWLRRALALGVPAHYRREIETALR